MNTFGSFESGVHFRVISLDTIVHVLLFARAQPVGIQRAKKGIHLRNRRVDLVFRPFVSVSTDLSGALLRLNDEISFLSRSIGENGLEIHGRHT